MFKLISTKSYAYYLFNTSPGKIARLQTEIARVKREYGDRKAVNKYIAKKFQNDSRKKWLALAISDAEHITTLLEKDKELAKRWVRGDRVSVLLECLLYDLSASEFEEIYGMKLGDAVKMIKDAVEKPVSLTGNWEEKYFTLIVIEFSQIAELKASGYKESDFFL